MTDFIHALPDDGFVKLNNRGLIRIGGPDRTAFLQALVSNDLDLLQTQASVYACLLTPQGKYLHDFIIFETGETLNLDCEGGEQALLLAKKLAMYKLRSRIEIDVQASIDLYAVSQPTVGSLPDPRHPSLGFRASHRPSGTEQPFTVWDESRIRLGMPDGTRDIAVAQSTLIECNIDRFNGISWDKGCYVGQELTARMHHRGLAKKHLYPVQWKSTPAEPGTDISINGQIIGQARSHCGSLGLALLKDEAASTLTDEIAFKRLPNPVLSSRSVAEGS